MHKATTLGHEIKILGIMALPLIVTGLIETSIGFTATLFAAHLGQQALVSTALVSSVFTTLMVFMWGLFSAVSTLVAQYHGANNATATAHVTRDAIMMGIGIGLPIMGLIWIAPDVLEWWGQWQAIINSIRLCLHSFIAGIIPDFLSIVLIQFLLGLGHTRLILVFSILFTLLNITANYVLMFGKWGFPSLGVAGVGWGASFSMWVSVFFLLGYLLMSPVYRNYISAFFKGKTFTYAKELCALGIPIGLMYCIEIGFFMMIAFMIGKVDMNALAAHQIAMQYFVLLASVVFCIEKVTSVRISYVLAEGKKAAVKMVGYASIFLSLLFMLGVAFFYWKFSLSIISVDLNLQAPENSSTIIMAQQFLMIAALFQIFEGICIAIFGALRGLKDTQFTMYVSLFTFWGIALPLSYASIILLHWDVRWVWWSMVISAIFEAVILFWRYQTKIQEHGLITVPGYQKVTN